MINIYLDEPVLVDVYEWMENNRGFVGLGEKTSDRCKVELFAYQKHNDATREIAKLAQKTDAFMMISNTFADNEI